VGPLRQISIPHHSGRSIRRPGAGPWGLEREPERSGLRVPGENQAKECKRVHLTLLHGSRQLRGNCVTAGKIFLRRRDCQSWSDPKLPFGFPGCGRCTATCLGLGSSCICFNAEVPGRLERVHPARAEARGRLRVAGHSAGARNSDPDLSWVCHSAGNRELSVTSGLAATRPKLRRNIGKRSRRRPFQNQSLHRLNHRLRFQLQPGREAQTEYRFEWVWNSHADGVAASS